MLVVNDAPIAEIWTAANDFTRATMALMIASRQPVRSSAPPNPSAINISEMVHIIDCIPPLLSSVSICSIPVCLV